MPKEDPLWVPTQETCEVFNCRLQVERKVREKGPHTGSPYFVWSAIHTDGSTLEGEESDIEDARKKAEIAGRTLHQLFD